MRYKEERAPPASARPAGEPPIPRDPSRRRASPGVPGPLLVVLLLVPAACGDAGPAGQEPAPLVRLVEHVTRFEHPAPGRRTWVTLRRRDELPPGRAFTTSVGWEPELLVVVEGEDVEKRAVAIDCLPREPDRDETLEPLLTVDDGFEATQKGWKRLVRAPPGTGALRVRLTAASETTRVHAVEIAGRDAEARVLAGSRALAEVEGRHPRWHPDAVVRHAAVRDLRSALKVMQGGVVECSFVAPPRRVKLYFGYLMLDRQAVEHAELAVEFLDAQGVPFKHTHRYPIDAHPAPSWALAEVGLNEQAGRPVTLRFRVLAPPPPISRGTAYAIPRHAMILVGSPIAIGGPATARPDLLLVSLDALRRDRLGAYGAADGPAPRLDALLAGGTVHEDARSPAAAVLPGHVSLWTGATPDEHGVVAPLERPAPGGPPRLFEALAASGYRTVAFTGGGFLAPEYGHARGFDVYVSFDPLHPDTPRRDTLAERLPPMLEPDAAPRAILVHSSLVHEYEAPRRVLREAVGGEALERWGWGRRLRDEREALARGGGDEALAGHVRAVYDASVRAADRALDEGIAALREAGRLEQTLVVLVAAHGEALGEDGRWGHGDAGAPEVARVPWLARGPGAAGGRRVTARVTLADVGPAIAERLDLAWAPATTRDGAGTDPDAATGGDDDWMPPDLARELRARGHDPDR